MEEYKFIAVVREVHDGYIVVEQRNKFIVGDSLEVLTLGEQCGKSFTVSCARDEDGNELTVCSKVQQLITVNCPYSLAVGDILRRKV